MISLPPISGRPRSKRIRSGRNPGTALQRLFPCGRRAPNIRALREMLVKSDGCLVRHQRPEFSHRLHARFASQREQHSYLGSSSFTPFRKDLAVVGFDQSLADGETETGPFWRARRVDHEKLLEYLSRVRFRHSQSTVKNSNVEPSSISLASTSMGEFDVEYFTALSSMLTITCTMRTSSIGTRGKSGATVTKFD